MVGEPFLIENPRSSPPSTTSSRGGEMFARRNNFCSAVAVMVVVVLFHGCTTTPSKPLAVKDLQSVKQIRLVRYHFPGYMKETTGSTVASAAAAAPFMLFGVVGGAVGGGLYGSIKSAMNRSAGREMQNKYNLPDFLEVVHREFAEKLPKDLPGWPEITVQADAINYDYTDPSACLLTLKSSVVVSDGDGVRAYTVGQLVNSAQNILWSRGVSYKSSDLNRPCKTDELEADNGKLLQEEVAFAVEKTVTELVEDLKNGSDKAELASTEMKKTD
jgi:hypothetical protein